MKDWISVDDKQPKEYEKVIAYFRRDSNQRIQVISWWRNDSEEVSHWMPLPEMPNKTGD